MLGLTFFFSCNYYPFLFLSDSSFYTSQVLLGFFPCMTLLRVYVSPGDKDKYSAAVPTWFDEIMCGLMLGDGNLRMNGKHALLSVQQIHEDLVKELWITCSNLKLVYTPYKILSRGGHQVIYYFQTLTMPYFTSIYNAWYQTINGKVIKTLPKNIANLLTPLAFSHWIMGDGAFDKYGRCLGRLTLHTDNFTLKEVEELQSILRSKYDIDSTLRRTNNLDPARGYRIRIPGRCIDTVRTLCAPHMTPSLMYKLGL